MTPEELDKLREQLDREYKRLLPETIAMFIAGLTMLVLVFAAISYINP